MAKNPLTWRNPPRGPGYRYGAEAERMRADPGEWLLIKEFPLEEEVNARNMATAIRSGRYTSFRPVGDWDATSAKEEGKNAKMVVNVYVCYAGSPPA
jgi:hypothetical protein